MSDSLNRKEIEKLLPHRDSRASPANYRRVQPAQRLAGGAAGLVDARVVAERKCQVRPVRRVSRLVGNQFIFRGEGTSRRKICKIANARINTRRPEFFFVKRISRPNCREQLAQTFELLRFDGLAAQ